MRKIIRAVTVGLVSISLSFGIPNAIEANEVITPINYTGNPVMNKTISVVSQLKSEQVNVISNDFEVLRSSYEDFKNDQKEEEKGYQEQIKNLNDRVSELETNEDELYSRLSDRNTKINELHEKLGDTQEENAKLKKHLAELEIKYVPVHFNPSDVREVSNASVAQLNKILEKTYLAGYGETFYNMEQEYGINALFSIGNSILETGWDGDNYLARNNNNIYGLNTGRVFSSKYDCINYWFNLLDRAYITEGRHSIRGIASKYCPPKSDEWATYIPDVVERLISKSGITMK